MIDPTSWFQKFDPSYLQAFRDASVQLIDKAGDSPSSAPVDVLRQLQALLRAAYQIAAASGADASEFASRGSDWRRQLDTYRQLDRDSSSSSDASSQRLSESIADAMDAGYLTFRVATAFHVVGCNLEQTPGNNVKMDGQLAQLRHDASLSAGKLIAALASIYISDKEWSFLPLLELTDDKDINAQHLIASAKAACLKGQPQGGNEPCTNPVSVLAGAVALPRFRELHQDTKLELWNQGDIRSLLQFDQTVELKRQASQALVNAVASAAALPCFSQFDTAAGLQLCQLGHVASVSDFGRNVQERRHVNLALIEALAAAAALPCYAELREPIAKELIEKGLIADKTVFYTLVARFEEETGVSDEPPVSGPRHVFAIRDLEELVRGALPKSSSDYRQGDKLRLLKLTSEQLDLLDLGEKLRARIVRCANEPSVRLDLDVFRELYTALQDRTCKKHSWAKEFHSEEIEKNPWTMAIFREVKDFLETKKKAS